MCPNLWLNQISGMAGLVSAPMVLTDVPLSLNATLMSLLICEQRCIWNLHRFMKICLKMQSAHENNWLKKCLTFKKNFCSRWMCVVVKSDKDPIILYQKMLDLFKFLQKYSYFRQSLLPLKEHLIKLNDLY